MPYKVMNEDGKFKVYKLGADNKPTGKPLGTHGNKAEASAQVRALYANEKKEAVTVTGANANVTVADSTGNATSNDFTIETTDVEGKALEELYQKMGYYAEPVMVLGGPTSFADLLAQQAAQEAAHEVHELTYHFSDLARNIMAAEIEDKGAALEALAGEYVGLVQEKLTMESDDKSLSIAKQIAGDNQPESKDTSNPQTTNQTPDSTNDPGGDSETKDTQSLFIWKENDQYYCLLAYSNNRRDEDNPPEIIASESHKEFDEALTKGEWPMPELWLWHVPYPVGKVFHHTYDESTGFPVALAAFDKDKSDIAKALSEAKGWDGVSHGMPSEWIQRDPSDPTVIVRHRTKEISILPRWAAANKLAFNIISKESGMSEETKGLPAHKRPDFVKLLGEEQTKQVEAVLDSTSKEADEAGTEKKEAAEDTPQAAETLTPDNPVVKALEMVVTQLTALETRLKEIEDKTNKVEEQLVKEEPFDLMAFLKSKSAVGQSTTKVRANSTLAKDAPEEAKDESYTEKFSGIRVSLVDELVGANQEYYNSRR